MLKTSLTSDARITFVNMFSLSTLSCPPSIAVFILKISVRFAAAIDNFCKAPRYQMLAENTCPFGRKC